MPKSPLTLKDNVLKKITLPVSQIFSSYKKNFQLDVSNFFKGLSELEIYECQDTGYCFYYPLNLGGDSKFYEYFQQYDWYYMPWKWEHQKTFEHLKGHEKILEVGSGGNGFLEKMSKEGFDITGLELNKDSVKKGQKKGLNVLKETINEHAINNHENYDVVCSYQVLEHIAEVHSFIKSSVDCLKPGGKLIISVPNNDSFIKYEKFNPLNMPPHHMGLWNEKSLHNLMKIFPLNNINIFFEPLQPYHFRWYLTLQESRFIPSKIIRGILTTSKLDYPFYLWIKKNANKIKGHSIFVIYEKASVLKV